MFRNVLLGSAAAIIISGSAFAADLPSKKSPAVYAPVPTFTWTGFYLGANAGYGFGRGKSSDIVFGGTPLPSRNGSFDTHGGLVGGQVGYNYQIGNIVLGAEADLDYTGVKGSYVGDPLSNSPSSIQGKLEYLGTVRARAGYAINNVLIFATGGFAYGSTKVSVTNLYGGATPVLSARETSTGYTLGGGVEYALTNNWTVKGEYLYVNLGKKSVSFSLPTYPVVTAGASSTTNILRVGVNYKF